MKYFFTLLIGLLIFGGVMYFQKQPRKNDTSNNPFAAAQEEFLRLEISELSQATFAGGCFWCMEGPFESMDGVVAVMAGYVGGEVEDPTYEAVTAEQTGHREGVRIYFDSKVVSFLQLLERYWYQVDPTDPVGQFADKGHRYTTAIYYHDDVQKNQTLEAITMLDASGKYEQEIVTEVLPVSEFYPAEDYHQDYYKHSSERYKVYKKGSGRTDYIKSVKSSLDAVFNK